MPGILLLAASALFAQGSDRPDRLAWMRGDWRCELGPKRRAGPTYTDEYWIGDGKGGLVGTGRVHQNQTVQLEQMRIAPGADGRMRFTASPGGAPPATFVEKESGPMRIVFEGPAHDYPQRITYSREGAVLRATISLIDGSRAQSWRFAPMPSVDGQWPDCREGEGR